jgi:hypothetical protein
VIHHHKENPVALIPFAEKKLIRPDARDPRIKPRIGILHIDAGNASSLYNLFLGNQRDGGSKVESHGFVKKDGTLEQYRDTDFEADAQAYGNPFSLSFETQGYGPGLWTAEQIAMIKRIMLWCRDEHGIPLRVVTSYNDPQGGWGFHRMFDQWNPNHHSCPGDDRVKQFYDVLVPWMKAQGNPAPAPDSPVVSSIKAVCRKRDISLVKFARSALYWSSLAKKGSVLKQVNLARKTLRGIDNHAAPGLLRDLRALRKQYGMSFVYLARVALREAATHKRGVVLTKVKLALVQLRGIDNPR